MLRDAVPELRLRSALRPVSGLQRAHPVQNVQRLRKYRGRQATILVSAEIDAGQTTKTKIAESLAQLSALCSLHTLNDATCTAATAGARSRSLGCLRALRLLEMLRFRGVRPLLKLFQRRRAEPAFDVIGLLQPSVEIARSGFRQLDARRFILALQSDTLDEAVKAFLGVLAAAVDGLPIALALIENFLDSLDEHRPLLRSAGTSTAATRASSVRGASAAARRLASASWRARSSSALFSLTTAARRLASAS